MSRFIALDMGAESGRAIVGELDAGRLTLKEVHRFANGGVRVAGSLHWDVLYQFNQMKQGLIKARMEYGQDFASVGVDTWGVDFALIDRDGNLVGNPYCYRDARTDGMMDVAATYISAQELFEQTGGIQFMPINTVFQLLSMVEQKSAQLDAADTFLMMPDLFNYWLTGRKVCEFTIATTSQFYNSITGDWARGVLKKLSIPDRLFPPVVMPGTNLGALLPDIADEVGLPNTPVIAAAGHDTAAASAAIPAVDDGFVWISSGTWSLLGGVADQPIVTPEALKYNVSSYGGASGKCMPWRNITGLWLVQECRRIWAKAGESFSYDDLTKMATDAKPFTAVIDPDHPSFLAPEDMPAAICGYCRDTGQSVPQTKGEIIRTALEGLALKYRWSVEALGIVLGREFNAIHIVGGGSKNKLLCQLTADAVNLPVMAGPVEATAIGSIAVQAVATGHLSSLDEARQVIRRSFEVETYHPGNTQVWDTAYTELKKIIA